MSNVETTSNVALSRRAKALVGTAVKFNQQLHEFFLDCVRHAKDFGPPPALAFVISSLPTHRMSLATKWLEAYTPVRVSRLPKDKLQKGQPGMKAHLSGRTETRVWDIEGAKATPFYAMPDAERGDPELPTLATIHDNILSFFGRMAKKAEAITDENEKKLALDEVQNVVSLIQQIEKRRETEATKAVGKLDTAARGKKVSTSAGEPIAAVA